MPIAATSHDVDIWLFAQGDWVTVDRLCERFSISDRKLRQLGSGFLVSRPGGGYIHRYHATPADLEAYCAPLRAHAVSEWKKIKLLRRLYRERRRPYPIDLNGQPSLL